jgi:hypothetical protein
MRRTVGCVVLLLAAAAGPALGAGAEKPSVTIPRVTEPPVLSRYLDGTTTPPGVRITGFVQREPGDGVPSSLETTAYLSYDEQHLYLVFVARDDPAKVRANMTKREAIMGDDLVAILLKIPFKSLRFSSAPAQTWGVAVGRIVPRSNEASFWPYITRRVAGFGQQMATLEGSQGISPGRNVQVIPYGNFAAARVLDDEGVRVTENSARAGVDGKAVIKDALTVDMTVNPDFSQIESDEPQVTVNQRFEVFVKLSYLFRC